MVTNAGGFFVESGTPTTVTNCRSAGAVTCVPSAYTPAGGFIGAYTGDTHTDCCFDRKENAGLSAAGAGTLVEDVTPGTAAVPVKSAGEEEVLKTSVVTDSGVLATLSDGDTVKLVDSSVDFADVPDSYCGAGAVDFVASRELFSGTGETTFSPEPAITRAMAVTVLAGLDGTDMELNLTREQLATMLWRCAGNPISSADLSGYTDADSISAWAQTAMARCVDNGITGTTSTTLSPQCQATRAQVAAMLMRFVLSSVK